MSSVSRFSFYISLGLILSLLSVSALCMWSIEVKASQHASTFIRHSVYALMALFLFIAVYLYGFSRVQKWVPLLYLGMIFALILVLIIGPRIAGSQRWIFLGPISFQPSEVAKLVLILSLSAHLSVIRKFNWTHCFLLSLHVVIPSLLIYKEPDLGTTLVVLGLFLSLLLVSSIAQPVLFFIVTPLMSLLLYYLFPVLWLVYLSLGLALVIGLYIYQKWARKQDISLVIYSFGILFINVSVVWGLQWVWGQLKPYQQQRILSFVSPAQEHLDSGYQVMQSKIAIGSGGLWGQGLFNGSQTQLKLVPEQRTDFIFSALGEELGFIGAGFVISLFIILILRILWVAYQSHTTQSRFFCTGVAAIFLMHISVNIGMNMGIVPVTGVPLPFFSYGGTAMLVQAVLLGLVESIAMEQQDTRWA